MDAARHYDTKVLIEEAVAGSEVGCAILGNGAELFAGEPDRVSLSHGFFRIHQEERARTRLGERDLHRSRRYLNRARVSSSGDGEDPVPRLGMRGLARVDLFLKDDGTVVLNEINTLPGLTSYSRYPRMMAAAGLSLGDVIDRVVSLALPA